MVQMKRQIPNPTELFDLVQLKKPTLNLKQRRLAEAQTIWDLRDIAKRRTPAAAFDYTDGAADEEISMRRARQAFRDVEFCPSILHDVSRVDTACTIFGGPSALPFGIAPTGFTRLMQTEGELASVRLCSNRGRPFGDDEWVRQVAGRLDLAATLKPRGRPRRIEAHSPA